MNSLNLLIAILNGTGTLLPLVQKLIADIAAGKGSTPLTDADWQALVVLSTQTSADIYKREGVTPPPAT